MNKLYVGLGSNLDNPLEQIKKAFVLLTKQGFDIKKKSSFYQSPAMANMQQPDYINAVCLIETKLNPIECLDALQSIEIKMGRLRKTQKWQARTLDLDIILYNQEIIKNKRLTIPHYGMLTRSFVIEPLLEIEPEAQHPIFGKLKNLDQKGFEEVAKKL